MTDKGVLMEKFGRLLATVIAGFAFTAPCFGDKLAVVPGSEASRENFQVSKRLGWQTNLDEARAEAAKTGRLVFWVHMLGSIDGKT